MAKTVSIVNVLEMVRMQIVKFFVGLLINGSAICAPGYALQADAEQAAKKTLSDLEVELKQGSHDAKIATLIAISDGDDEIEKRLRLIGSEMSNLDQSVRFVCDLSIRRMEDRVDPGLRKLLDSDAKQDQIVSSGILRAMDKPDKFAADVFPLLSDEDNQLRHAALYALQNMSPEVIVKELDLVTKQLDSTSFNIQCMACAVLRKAGPSAKPAAARLVRLLQDGNVSSRSRASQALAAIGSAEGFDIPALVAKQLDANAHPEKTRALEAMADLGPIAGEHLEKIEILMLSPKHNCTCEAALAYYQVSGESQRPLQILLGEAAKPSHRLVAIECLGGMKEGAAQAVPALIEFLGDKDLVTAETATLALKNIGPDAEAALPQLKKMLKHKDFLMSVAAQEAIDSITATKEDQ